MACLDFNAKDSSVRDYVSEGEWETRQKLAALYRAVDYHGMAGSIYNHISVRVPGDANALLINPFGLMYGEVTASSLVRIDFNGNIELDPLDMGINHAGFVIHGAIHRARNDVHCVIHTHTPFGVAVSVQKGGLLSLTQSSAFLYDDVGYHAFEGAVVSNDEQRRLVDDLGNKRALILKNHGLITAGRSIGEAFMLMCTLEEACQAQILAQSSMVPLQEIDEAAAISTGEAFRKYGSYERDEAAILRLAQRIAPDHKN